MVDLLKDLRDGVEYVKQISNSVEQETSALMYGTVGEKLETQLQFYFLLKTLKEQGENLAKLFNVCGPDLAGRINKNILAEGLDQIVKTIDGERISITPDTKWHISCNKDNKDKMIAFMKADPIGKELVKEDVHAKSLEKFVKEEIIGKAKVPPPGLFSIHAVETIVTRKLPK